MLGVLCAARPKPWILSSVSLTANHHGSAAHHHHQYQYQGRLLLSSSILSFADKSRKHTSACQLGGSVRIGGAASIWRAILPACDGGDGDDDQKSNRRLLTVVEQQQQQLLTRGEGSWNVAWDARPARWLHRVDSAWLLFGVCACLAPIPEATAVIVEEPRSDQFDDVKPKELSVSDNKDKNESQNQKQDVNQNANQNQNQNQNDEEEKVYKNPADYKVIGVLADGRCLFRAMAHGACLNSGEEAPDENRQRELADELRAKVADELLKRRKEIEWFLEEKFETYVKRIRQPYVWGGEPEIMMAAHVLKTLIQVYINDRDSGKFLRIAKYGDDYLNENESPIDVLFHGYGHYDILEAKLPENKLERKVPENKLDIQLLENNSIQVGVI